MRRNFINWLYILEENLHPSVLIKTVERDSDLLRYLDELKKGTQQFKPYFINLVGHSGMEAKAILLQLTMVSDTLHNYMVSMASSWRKSPFSIQLHRLYLQMLNLLERLLEFCGKFDKHTLLTLPLTLYSIPNIRMGLRKKLNNLNRTIL